MKKEDGSFGVDGSIMDGGLRYTMDKGVDCVATEEVIRRIGDIMNPVDYVGKRVVLTCKHHPLPIRARVERLTKAGLCAEIWGFVEGTFWEEVKDIKILDEIV